MQLSESIKIKNAGSQNVSTEGESVAKIIQKQQPSTKVTAPGVSANAKTNARF